LRDTIRKYPNRPEELENDIKAAIDNKPKGHDFDYSRANIKGQMSRHMSHTGG
jgi:cyclic pyranopterin phosphate synthase